MIMVVYFLLVLFIVEILHFKLNKILTVVYFLVETIEIDCLKED